MLGSVTTFICIVLLLSFFFISLDALGLSHENKKNNMTHKKYLIYKLIKLRIIFKPVLSLFSG